MGATGTATERTNGQGSLPPLLWLSLSFLGGIVLAARVVLSVRAWIALAGATTLLVLLQVFVSRRVPLLRSGRLFLPALMLLFFGAARYQSTIPTVNPHFIAWYADRDYDLLITGTLVEPPDYRDTYTNLRLRVEEVDTGNEAPLAVEGLILARVDPNRPFHYGDRLRLRGRLMTPPEGEEFSYREYLAHKGIHAYMPSAEATLLPGRGGNAFLSAVYAAKEHALITLYQLYPDPEASLLAGILLGVDTGLPKDLAQAFKDTGTAHIIAISGFNIAIIAGLFMALFGRLLGPRRGAVAALVAIAVYTILVGADAAVVRAAIMGSLSIFARQIGRRQDGLNTLLFTAALMALLDPHIPWDVGFQLSFFATLGLLLYAEPFQQAVVTFLQRFTAPGIARRLSAPIAEYFLFTLAAQLTTLPITAYHFKRLSLVSLVANPVILPAQPPVMVLSGLALLIGLFWWPLGQTLAWLSWPFTAYTIHAVELFAQLPHAVITLGDLSPLLVILFYGALFSWTFAGNRLKRSIATRTGGQPLALPVTALFILYLTATLTWRLAQTAPDGRLHLLFLDVGSADAILIKTPTGRAVLVNGGPSPSRLSSELGRRLPLTRRRLDFLVVASPQEAQVAALPRTLERFPPQAVLWSGKQEASFSARILGAYLSEQRVPITQAWPGAALDLGAGAALRVVTAGPRGAVLLVEWGNFRALLPVGVDFSALEELRYGEAIGEVSVLLLAESGYALLNPPEWLRHLNPQVVILSVAAGDTNGLPSEETLQAVEDYSLLRTDRHGWIHLSTDGERMWVEVERAEDER
ncbi:MAG: ComEC/Rec2 family competence protein [Anaerolineae bacterium]|nr:MAG: ComEC/Rec2 family competence protein [Anaerolineae bacterium]